MNRLLPDHLPDPLLNELRLVLGPEQVLSGAAIAGAHCQDWSGAEPVRPLAVLRPGSSAEVAHALAICQRHRVPVVPQGGLTGLAGGAVPVPQGVALSLARMNAIVELDAAAATVTVQAGATLASVQQAAAVHGLCLGVDLGARGSCQIGGCLSTNAGGLGVLQYGMMREQCLGLEAVLADGTLLPMLRPMLKNNTGYDLKQLFIGAEGTLGVITAAVLRLRAAPAARATALVGVQDYRQVLILMQRLQSHFLGGLAAFELMWADFLQLALDWSGQACPLAELPPLAVLIEVSGNHEALLQEGLEQVLGELLQAQTVADAVIAQSGAQAQALWRLREAPPAEFHSRMQPHNFDISLPLAQLGGFAERCQQALSARWPSHQTVRFGHVGDGNLHLSTDLRSLGGLTAEQAEHQLEQLVYGLVAEAGGSISAEHGIGQLKKPYLGASRTAQEIAVMLALKQALDPLNQMNPGRVIGRD
jgi:FAD/FMN-containing dehydrogenase